MSYAQNFTSVKKRFHKSKLPSTMEIWDKERRNGKFICFNSKGDTLVQYNLRRYAGHSSAWTEYYRNGQVRKLELSNAPDAGIQYYREIIFFDQNGKETHRFKQSNEDRVTTQTKF
jgi:hypothetical protein